jgi:hypothetical protein
MKISAYTTIFNLKNIQLSIIDALDNWFYYFDEVIISTLTKDVNEINEEIKNYKFFDKIKIVDIDIDFNNLFWDGILKNNGLQNCSNEIVFQIDLDERVSGNKEFLENLYNILISQNKPCSLMLKTIDLFDDLDHYKNIGQKWYIHTKKDCYRGAVNFAKINDKLFDPEKSDTCELIDQEGNLIDCLGCVNITNDSIKIIHLGFLDLNRRSNLNKTFWKNIWSERKSLSQNKNIEANDVFINSSDFKITNKYKHNLNKPLWPKI